MYKARIISLPTQIIHKGLFRRIGKENKTNQVGINGKNGLLEKLFFHHLYFNKNK